MTPGDIRDYFGRPPSLIAERHWQGGFPVPFVKVVEHGVDVVVLTASDAQPDRETLTWVRNRAPGLSGVLCPFDDTEDAGVFPRIIEVANRAADRVAEHLAAGKTVLVTCAVGRNRSGLVSALTLMRRYGVSGKEAVAMVRKARDPLFAVGEGALTNWRFATYLESLPARKP